MYIANSRATTENQALDTREKERKQNHVKCSPKTTKDRQGVEDKTGTKNEGNERKQQRG